MSYPFLGGFGLQYVCSICLASSLDGSGDVNGQCRIISASHVVLTLPRPNGRRRRYLPSNTVSGRSCSLSSSNLSLLGEVSPLSSDLLNSTYFCSQIPHGSKSSSPVNSSKRVQPSDHISTAQFIGVPISISGGEYAHVAMGCPVRMCESALSKSISLISCLELHHRRFRGLMSV